MKNIIYFFVLLFAIQSFGQDTIPYKYYDKNFNSTLDPKKVAYFSFLEFDKKEDRNNLITYDLNGKIRKYERFSSLSKNILEGISEELYENGNVMSQKSFNNGKEHGKYLRFWENQILKREDNYLDGKFVDGKCFDENGKEVEYYPFSVNASYPQGIAKFYDYISKSIFKSLIKSNGRMLVSFTIDTTGAVTDIKIIKDLNDKNLNSNVIGVLRTSPKWIPAIYDGKLVSMVFTLPINFEIGKISFLDGNGQNQSDTPSFRSQIIRF